MTVPTVERGLFDAAFCSMEMFDGDFAGFTEEFLRALEPTVLKSAKGYELSYLQGHYFDQDDNHGLFLGSWSKTCTDF